MAHGPEEKKTQELELKKIAEQWVESSPLFIAREHFPLWAQDHGVLGETGEHPSFDDRPYLDAIYENEARETVIRKCNQVGISAWAILKTIWGTTFHWPKGAGYFLPHGSNIGDFVRQKVNPSLLALPEEYAPIDTDNVGMKSMAAGDLFLRGIASEGNRQAISIDAAFLDERDMMLDEDVDDVIQRTEDSSYQIIAELGRPSTPGYGIDKRFNLSTMNFYNIPCEHCNKDFTIEDSWPECVRGKPLRVVCPKCHKPANTLDGNWRPRQKSDIMGFTVNGLLNPNANLETYMARYMDPSKRGTFMRANLGLPHIEEGAGINMKDLLAQCCDPVDELSVHPGPTYLGMDVGDKLHGMIMAPDPKFPRIIKVFEFDNWGDVDPLMRAFNVGRAVVDALPDKRGARAFCNRFPGRAYMCYYDRNRRGAVRWNDREHIVSTDRTESLDLSHTPLYTAAIRLPRENLLIRMLAKHCESLIRIVEELPDGNQVAMWVKRGPDHLRHGFNYAWLAASKVQYQTLSQ